MAQVIPLGGGLAVPSSFGVDGTTLGPAFRARQIIESERYRLLDRKQAYYSCTQHDWKQHDFDGRPMPTGNPLLGQPNLASAPSDWYVPLRMRRPNAPYRLSRTIVDSFTNLVFGYQRWPTIRCPEDPDTEAFSRALVDASGLRTLMIRARTIGGSTGSVGVSWRFHAGKPAVQVHNPKHIYVHSWADREQLIPSHVMEIYKFPRDEWDPQKQKFVRNWYWFRRDWTEEADVAFHEQLFTPAQDPEWKIDEENTFAHGDGFTHFVWGQNLPGESPEEFDGTPDYEGLYETFDSLDTLHSTLVRGTTLNLDPTLILKLDPDIVARTGIQKGTDNALLVGTSGDARYMELQGTSVTVGLSLFTKMREGALETAQCVVPDPNQIGAAGTSSVAIKIVYAPMLGKADILREQYEHIVRRVLVQMIRSARRMFENVEIETSEDGEEVERQFYLSLPPVVRTTPVLDGMGEPTGETTTEEVDLSPGESNVLAFDWGDYFLPTAQDQAQIATTLVQMTTGGLISQESGADLAARAVRIDPRADWDRITEEKKAKEQGQEQMFQQPGGYGVRGGRGGIGGKVGSMNELPPDALPRGKRPAGSDVITVDESRAMLGLPALGGADGGLTLAEFAAKNKASVSIAVETAKHELQRGTSAHERREAALADITPPKPATSFQVPLEDLVGGAEPPPEPPPAAPVETEEERAARLAQGG